MGTKRKIGGGILAVLGFMLSPLSWWNDLFVNLPLALAFAWLVSAAWPAAFDAAVVLGYWLTNVLGFILMHKGAQIALTEGKKLYSSRELFKDLAISLLYTAFIVILIKLGALKPIQDY